MYCGAITLTNTLEVKLSWLLFQCYFRVTNVTVNEVDQAVISNVIEVRMYSKHI